MPSQTNQELIEQQNKEWADFNKQAAPGEGAQYLEELGQKAEPQQATTEQEREHEQGLGR